MVAARQRPLAMRLDGIQPCQLCISAAKLARVTEGFDPGRPQSLDPLPVTRLSGRAVLTDGHTGPMPRSWPAWSRSRSPGMRMR